MNYFKLSIFWIILTAIVNPFGEFPLNDDWAYYKDVLNLINHGHLEFVDWSAMTLVSQIFLGSFLCKICGFSFSLLRILTSIIGLIGILTSYKILKETTSNDRLSFFVSILLMGNPLFFSLSNTFMTDIYFYTFSVVSIFYFIRSLSSNKLQQIFIATVFVIIATLIRQIGIIIPISFALVSYYKSSPINKSTIVRFLAPLFFTGITLFLFNYWVSFSHKNLTSYFSLETMFSNIEIKTFSHIFYRLGTTGMILGLFLFPLLILLLPRFINSFWRRENRLSLIITIIFSVPLIRAWNSIPLGNIFFNFGLGPKLLKDVYILHTNNYPALNAIAMNVLRVISLAGGIMLFYLFLSYLFNLKKPPSATPEGQNVKIFSLIIVILYFGTFVIPDFFFDRYLIQLMLPLIVVILPFSMAIDFKNKYLIISYSFAFLFLLFSVGLTHDYLSWNRARWQGLNYLMTDLKKSPHRIDGGFEFNGWFQTGAIQQGKIKSWWMVDNDDYILTFGPLPGYKILKLIPYSQYIPFEKEIYTFYIKIQ